MRHRIAFEDQLAQVPLFAGLSRDDLHQVSRLAVRAHEGTGTHLVREGERGDELLVILEGTVDVRHERDVLATLHAGDHLGEVALLDPRARRTASVVATSPVTVAYLGRHEFDLMIRQSVDFVLALLAVMAIRIIDQETD